MYKIQVKLMWSSTLLEKKGSHFWNDKFNNDATSKIKFSLAYKFSLSYVYIFLLWIICSLFHTLCLTKVNALVIIVHDILKILFPH